jgi:hypothetical protein
VKKEHSYDKIQSRVMELVQIIATVMSDNYVKFQSSIFNGYCEKVNLNKNYMKILSEKRGITMTKYSQEL